MKEMLRKGIAPTTITYSILMKAYVDAGRLERAVEVMEVDMALVDVKPVADNVNVILSAFAKRRDVASAVLIFEKMKANGVQMDRISYNIMINAAGRAGDVHMARVFLEKMEQSGIEPNAVSFRSLLKAYGRKLDVRGEQKVLNELQARKIDVDVQMMTSMIHTLLLRGELNKALSLFHSLPSKMLQPDAFLCNKMLCALMKMDVSNGPQRAKALLDDMRARNYPTDQHTDKIAQGF